MLWNFYRTELPSCARKESCLMTNDEKFRLQRRTFLRSLWQSLSGTPDGFFVSVRLSHSDFRIFDSAPAASRRDKTSVAKLNLGFGSKIRRCCKASNETKTVANLLQTVFSCGLSRTKDDGVSGWAPVAPSPRAAIAS